MHCIAECGKQYGLSLNWTKVEQMAVQCEAACITDPHGQAIQSKSSLKYLGAQLAANGQVESEVLRKIGLAASDFRTLRRIWQHCNISIRFKFIVFQACIIQKLLYSLESAWLNKALLRQLDGFYCRCLRQILKISPSFISRVSNRYVLEKFSSMSLSDLLLRRQLKLFGDVVRLPPCVLRRTVFKDHSIDLIDHHQRRRGRPRNSWASELLKHVRIIAANAHSDIMQIIMNKKSWDTKMHQYTGHNSDQSLLYAIYIIIFRNMW